MALSILTGGRASGKTTSLMHDAILTAMEPNRDVVFVAKSHIQRGFIRQEMMSIVIGLDLLRNSTNTVINYKNGSRVRILDPISAVHLRGIKITDAFLDEPDEKVERVMTSILRVLPELNITISEYVEKEDD